MGNKFVPQSSQSVKEGAPSLRAKLRLIMKANEALEFLHLKLYVDVLSFCQLILLLFEVSLQDSE
jgi:hypothetical protein